MSEPLHCPDCNEDPSVDSDIWGTSIHCRGCYDAELLDNQWVAYGRHAQATSRARAVEIWNEDIEEGVGE